jgi:hypothetical protein
VIPRKIGAAFLALHAEQSKAFQASAFWPMQDFGAQARLTLTRSATKTASISPPIEGAALIRCRGQGRPIKAGEFILGYPG